MDFYPRLKDLREDCDLSQEQIAKVLGTDQSYYAKYENGKRPITFERAIILAKFYNVSLDYIAGLTKDKGGLHKKSDKSINIDQSHSNKPVVKIKK